MTGLALLVGFLLGIALAYRVTSAGTVPRDAYNERGARIHDLALQRDRLVNTCDMLHTEILRMKRDGFVPQRPAKITEAPDAEAEGLASAEAQLVVRHEKLAFLKRYAARVVEKTGCSEAEAMREANEHWNALKSEDPPT